MVVGHTHEDIDGCFSLVTAALKSEPTLETPADIMRPLECPIQAHPSEVLGQEAWAALQQEQPRVQNRVGGHSNSPLIVCYFTSEVRDWCKVMPQTASLKNAYKTRHTDEDNNMKVPQSFSFTCRQGPGAGCRVMSLIISF